MAAEDTKTQKAAIIVFGENFVSIIECQPDTETANKAPAYSITAIEAAVAKEIAQHPEYYSEAVINGGGKLRYDNKEPRHCGDFEEGENPEFGGGRCCLVFNIIGAAQSDQFAKKGVIDSFKREFDMQEFDMTEPTVVVGPLCAALPPSFVRHFLSAFRYFVITREMALVGSRIREVLRKSNISWARVPRRIYDQTLDSSKSEESSEAPGDGENSESEGSTDESDKEREEDMMDNMEKRDLKEYKARAFKQCTWDNASRYPTDKAKWKRELKEAKENHEGKAKRFKC